MGAAEKLIVVRRGESRLFEVLRQRFATGASPVRVIWDRRVRDRRVIVRDDLSPERRRGERRGPTPSTWATHGFLLTRRRPAGGDTAARPEPETRAPLAPGRAQALIESASRSGSTAPCRHQLPRGLRTDSEHVHLYARLLRESRPLSGEWASSRLRSLARGPLT